ncbi:MAG TPA: ribonuclease HI [Candidatus Microbacterium stercoravium]|uniref:Ribonuclease H n=1 Tax=Candidatus Microbacterium stercoravium TaxID=2838697 RepID=A0A9D2H850_9MICO|nr:ribonuclease HI [Candidatus Microbacterium stercoravium]
MTIIAAADGSALGNPGPMGWAWYIDDNSWAAGGAPYGTNNIGELTAVLELLRATAHTDDDLLIHCDSRYVIDSITKWMPGWKKKGWKKADGKPVMNLEIIKALDCEISGRSVRFEWVKGHAGHPLNEAADSRANGAAQAYQNGTPVNSGPGFAGAAPAAPPAPPAPQPVETQPTLFDDIDDDPFSEIRVVISPEEQRRLGARARAAGVSPEEFLRGLI